MTENPSSFDSSFFSTQAINESPAANTQPLVYRDGVVRLFLVATIFWGLLSSLVWFVSGLLLSRPALFANVNDAFQPLLTFARFDAVRANLAIFAIGGNAVFAGVYYSVQRLCKASLWSTSLAILHFVSWQAVMFGLVASQWLGLVQGRSLSGGPWPIDVAIAILWIGFFGINFAMTVAKRQERHLYVSLWFYLSSIVAVGFLQIANCLVMPTGWLQSLPLLAGVEDAWLANWTKHGLVAFLLTMPFVGMSYYYLPKAIERPLYSYKWSIVHFWSMLILLLCASSKELHLTTIPEWASTLGMLCGAMLWLPSWAGLVNVLAVFAMAKGAWGKLRQDASSKFLIAGLLVFGFTSLESSILSIKSVHAMVHYTDWEVAHWDAFMLGWIGFTVFGTIYWLMPRLVHCNLKRWSQLHFVLAVAGLLFTVLPEYASGFVQARKWSQLSDMGKLDYSFMESLQSVSWLWGMRLIGGVIYLAGLFGLALNMLLLLGAKAVQESPQLSAKQSLVEPSPESFATVSALAGKPVLEFATKLDRFAMLHWHRRLERQPIRFALLIALAVGSLSLLQIGAMLGSKKFVAPIPSVQPYTPLEWIGREIYVSHGCQNCHSQMVRPLVYESQRYGAISQAAESIFDRPSLWGERRIGPDLAREGGGRQSSFWHWRHFENPPAMTQGTVMPTFKHLLATKLPLAKIGEHIRDLSALGIPYDLTLEDDQTIDSKFEKLAIHQAETIAAEIIGQGGPVAYEGNFIKDTSAIALIAYIQRLGTDLSRPAPTTLTNDTQPK